MSVNSTKVVKEFNRIKKLGFVENVKENHHDGSAGNTFEHYLGVKENNQVKGFLYLFLKVF